MGPAVKAPSLGPLALLISLLYVILGWAPGPRGPALKADSLGSFALLIALMDATYNECDFRGGPGPHRVIIITSFKVFVEDFMD